LALKHPTEGYESWKIYQKSWPPPNLHAALAKLQNVSIEKSKVVVYISHVQYIQRRLATVLLDAARHFPAVVVTGPRRAGKTTLLRKLFPKAQYVLLEDPDAAKIKNLRQAERYLPDNIYDALDNFRKGDWISTIFGEDVKGRYADLKQGSADRCPRLLGTFVKPQEVQFHHEVYNQFLWNLF
jgi:hypothetical protein